MNDTFVAIRKCLAERDEIGRYEILGKGGKVAGEIPAISLRNHVPQEEVEYRIKEGSGIEAVMSSFSAPEAEFHYGQKQVWVERTELTFIQHDRRQLEALENIVKHIYSISGLRPLEPPIYRAEMSVQEDKLSGVFDRTYVPARALLRLRKTWFRDPA